MVFGELLKLVNISICVGCDFRMVSPGSVMSILEECSHLANIAMGIAVCYGAFSLHSWRRQSVANRRADTATDVLGELEYFHFRLERLVDWQYLLNWDEWEETFNEIFHANFLLAKIKAERLKKDEINKLLDGMEKASRELPGNQRFSTQHDPQGHLFWKKEALEAKKKFEKAWGRFKKDWAVLKDLLSKEGLYEMSP